MTLQDLRDRIDAVIAATPAAADALVNPEVEIEYQSGAVWVETAGGWDEWGEGDHDPDDFDDAEETG